MFSLEEIVVFGGAITKYGIIKLFLESDEIVRLANEDELERYSKRRQTL